MFKWLKNKIFKNELDRLKNAEEKLKEATAESLKLISEASKLRATITKLINIGVDISRPPDKSWAVVCIGGKPEYVDFREFSRGEIIHVINFLKQFKGSNKIIDSPDKTLVSLMKAKY